MEKFPEQIILKELHDELLISSRAYNVCDQLLIKTTIDLSKYISKYKTFLNITRCGSKTNRELLSLNKYYTPSRIESYFLQKAFLNSKVSETEISFDKLFEAKFEEMLGVRAKKALMIYFNYKMPDENDIVWKLIISKFDPLRLRNIGVKTSIEIQKFISEAIKLYYQFNDTEGIIRNTSQ